MDRSGEELHSGSEAAVKANGSAQGQQKEEKRAGRGKKKCGRERAAVPRSGQMPSRLLELGCWRTPRDAAALACSVGEQPVFECNDHQGATQGDPPNCTPSAQARSDQIGGWHVPPRVPPQPPCIIEMVANNETSQHNDELSAALGVMSHPSV